MQYDEFTEGWTAPIEYDLLNDGASFDGSGMTPGIALMDKDGKSVPVAGSVEWAAASLSRIRFNPDANDLLAAKSPYTVHFRVTDALRTATYPQGEGFIWNIWPA